MNATVKKIKSRGYWRVLIRPGEYQAHRVENILDLKDIARDSAVQITGWDFPHVEYGKIEVGENHIEQAVDWEHYVEYWRLYRSGQFLFLAGIWNDWLDQSSLWSEPPEWGTSKRLGVGDVSVTLIELFEFASRLANSPAGGDTIRIEVMLYGLADRVLWLDAPNRIPFSRSYTTGAEKWEYSVEMGIAELLSETWETPLRATQDLLRRFGWDAGTDLLWGIVERIRL